MKQEILSLCYMLLLVSLVDAKDHPEDTYLLDHTGHILSYLLHDYLSQQTYDTGQALTLKCYVDFFVMLFKHFKFEDACVITLTPSV